MKIFDKYENWNDRVNFVDENNVLLGYDMSQSCCEKAYWFIADEITLNNTVSFSNNSNIPNDIEEWVFDPTFHEEIWYERSR